MRCQTDFHCAFPARMVLCGFDQFAAETAPAMVRINRKIDKLGMRQGHVQYGAPGDDTC